MSGRAERLRWFFIGGPRLHHCEGPLHVKVTRLLELLIGILFPRRYPRKSLRSPSDIQ